MSDKEKFDVDDIFFGNDEEFDKDDEFSCIDEDDDDFYDINS